MFPRPPDGNIKRLPFSDNLRSWRNDKPFIPSTPNSHPKNVCQPLSRRGRRAFSQQMGYTIEQHNRSWRRRCDAGSLSHACHGEDQPYIPSQKADQRAISQCFIERVTECSVRIPLQDLFHCHELRCHEEKAVEDGAANQQKRRSVKTRADVRLVDARPMSRQSAQ